MGRVMYTGRAREELTGCEATKWESKNLVRCLVTHCSSGDTASGDDGRGAGRECDAGMVTGLGVIELDATVELIGDSVGVSDDTQGRAWGLWRTRVGLGRGTRDATH